VKNVSVLCARHILDICAYLKGEGELIKPPPLLSSAHTPLEALDLADVVGQPQAKRALEIAAAGKHSLILLGPPGTGKTMLANRLPSILPALNDEQALETAAVASMSSSGFNPASWQQMPFRSPHHTVSSVALVGGGRPPRPGEISLAHQGILFLDELPEFSQQVLESLREPLESGHITISRASYQTVFPAKFQLLAAMNPCPCGYVGHAHHECQCTPEKIQRYLAKLSGPFIDRVDMQVEVPALAPEILASLSPEPTQTSQQIRERVCRARELQMQRQGKTNAELSVKELKIQVPLTAETQKILQTVMEKFHFSARIYHRIIKVALTIADLAGERKITPPLLCEALLYRALDKQKNLFKNR
jgi:magnesium chelatase family protein